MPAHVNNITVPAGKFMFDEFVNGKRTGERYMGSTTGGNLAVTTQNITVFDPDFPIHQKLLDRDTQADYSGTIDTQDVSLDNLGAWYMGAEDTVSQTATPVAAEPINSGNAVIGGRWYQLGQTAANPGGVRNVSTVTVNDAVVPATAYTLDTDYELDLVRARIYIVPGGAADGKTITSGYTPTVGSRQRIRIDTFTQRFGSIRFLADNTAGANNDIYIPYAALRPAGNHALKETGNNNVALQFAFSAQQSPIAGEPLIVLDGVTV